MWLVKIQTQNGMWLVEILTHNGMWLVTKILTHSTMWFVVSKILTHNGMWLITKTLKPNVICSIMAQRFEWKVWKDKIVKYRECSINNMYIDSDDN